MTDMKTGYRKAIKNFDFLGYKFEKDKLYFVSKKNEQYMNVRTNGGTVVWIRTPFFNTVFE